MAYRASTPLHVGGLKVSINCNVQLGILRRIYNRMLTLNRAPREMDHGSYDDSGGTTFETPDAGDGEGAQASVFSRYL
jgi:hypothetical protein